jgi:hypothetical protein
MLYLIFLQSWLAMAAHLLKGPGSEMRDCRNVCQPAEGWSRLPTLRLRKVSVAYSASQCLRLLLSLVLTFPGRRVGLCDGPRLDNTGDRPWALSDTVTPNSHVDELGETRDYTWVVVIHPSFIIRSSTSCTIFIAGVFAVTQPSHRCFLVRRSSCLLFGFDKGVYSSNE